MILYTSPWGRHVIFQKVYSFWEWAFCVFEAWWVIFDCYLFLMDCDAVDEMGYPALTYALLRRYRRIGLFPKQPYKCQPKIDPLRQPNFDPPLI